MQLVPEAGIIELMGAAGTSDDRDDEKLVVSQLDESALAGQHYGHERLDQLTVEHILGVR